MRLPEARSLLPSLLYLRDEAEAVMIFLMKTTSDPLRESRKVDEIIQHIKKMQDDVVIDESCTKPEPHSDVYLASACTQILEDLVQVYTDREKKDRIEPMRQCAQNIEDELDKYCSFDETRAEAGAFIERIYRKIDEVNY